MAGLKKKGGDSRRETKRRGRWGTMGKGEWGNNGSWIHVGCLSGLVDSETFLLERRIIFTEFADGFSFSCPPWETYDMFRSAHRTIEYISLYSVLIFRDAAAHKTQRITALAGPTPSLFQILLSLKISSEGEGKGKGKGIDAGKLVLLMESSIIKSSGIVYFSLLTGIYQCDIEPTTMTINQPRLQSKTFDLTIRIGEHAPGCMCRVLACKADS